MTVYQVLLGIQFAGILLMMFMCGTIARRWTRPQHGWLFFYCIVTLVNNAGYLGVMQATSEEAAILALQFSYLGRIWIPFSLLCFVLELCERRLNPRVLSVLATFHALAYLSILGIRHHSLYYGEFRFVTEGIFPHIVHTNGILHHIQDLLILAYTIIGVQSLLGQFPHQKQPRRRKQLLCICAAILTDVLFFGMQMLHLVPGYDLTSMGYTLATIFLYLAVFRHDMLGARELARSYVLDHMSEGFVITDEDDEVVACNQTARSLLPLLESSPCDALSQVRSMMSENRALESGGRKYSIKEQRLTDEKHAAGYVYMFSDDTLHYRHAEQLTHEMMLALSKTVDAKDHYTNGHSQRVADYAREIARRMGKSPEEQEKIYEMGLLHDIGKIGISGEILNKTSRLTDEEFAHIKEHTVIGDRILRQITVMPELASGARSHHERYDGRGYPDGLKGEEIPESARIICLADCYDAMTSTRTYSAPRPQATVRAEIVRCSGSQFDPAIAGIMLDMIDQDTAYAMHE